MAKICLVSAARNCIADVYKRQGLHYLDWTSRTTEKTSNKSHKDDFGYLELEGGANFSWGEMYGFFDWENFYNGRHSKSGSEQRYTFKSTNRIYLGDTGLDVYKRQILIIASTVCGSTASRTIIGENPAC